MKVFKFGGASVNSAEAVRNMARIVQHHLAGEPLAVVVSAMGKTTNDLEALARQDYGSEQWGAFYDKIEQYHRGIACELLPGGEEVQQRIGNLLAHLADLCRTRSSRHEDDAQFSASIVVHGEILSTNIIHAYLSSLGIRCRLTNALEYIQTQDGSYSDARVDWQRTLVAVRHMWNEGKDCDVVLAQGFIASPDGGVHPCTLGREGSDYTASILAYCLDAESVTIWKDVPGFLNADPKYFPDTIKIEQIPYNEAIELAYYGASVIHPKTVKPIQNKGIPLYIRSFITPEGEGSSVGNYHTIKPETPLYIFRNNQILLSILPRDFSFIAEDNLEYIFGRLNALGIRVNLMQNSALSFSICVDHDEQRIAQLMEDLSSRFQVRYNDNLQLVTIRYYTQTVIDSIVAGRKVLLEQRSRSTEQIVVQRN